MNENVFRGSCAFAVPEIDFGMGTGSISYRVSEVAALHMLFGINRFSLGDAEELVMNRWETIVSKCNGAKIAVLHHVGDAPEQLALCFLAFGKREGVTV